MRGFCKLDFVDEVCSVVGINHRWEVVKSFFYSGEQNFKLIVIFYIYIIFTNSPSPTKNLGCPKVPGCSPAAVVHD
jgi:hypothetical protein